MVVSHGFRRKVCSRSLVSSEVFNQYNAGDEKDCRLWSKKVLTLVTGVIDSGSLMNPLWKKFAALVGLGTLGVTEYHLQLVRTETFRDI